MKNYLVNHSQIPGFDKWSVEDGDDAWTARVTLKNCTMEYTVDGNSAVTVRSIENGERTVVASIPSNVIFDLITAMHLIDHHSRQRFLDSATVIDGTVEDLYGRK